MALVIIGGVSVLVAAVSLIATWTIETRSRDVATVIGLGREYREEWERRWLKAVEGFETSAAPEVTPDLLAALNWLDWLGVLVRERAFRSHALIFQTVGPSMSRILRAGHGRVEADGLHSWRGIAEVVRILRTDDRCTPLLSAYPT